MPGDHVQNHLRSPNPMHLCSSELGEALLSTLPFFDDSNRRGKGRLRMRFKLNHHLLWLYLPSSCWTISKPSSMPKSAGILPPEHWPPSSAVSRKEME